ncbi:MAG: translation elongation factor Ts [Gammaproteobacteria bacterium]|nr:translation elongation factor Ts [Gammaproteobacteria bacterium]MDH5594872.1 translation elongation factor Ts [Gammaproteobacteria bacterium]MDH5614406.1 translation elongation factor Ts [Gammaproteobacteria bacterium]
MEIKASMVKELRERTGAGMMECKKALTETSGDIEAAIEHMRKTGLAKADKKADRVAAEGLIEFAFSNDGKTGCVVEVNCETDFVTKGDDFKNFVTAVANCILENKPADLEALLATPITGGGDNVEIAQKNLISKIGENIQVRRFVLKQNVSGNLSHYKHGSRIGVMVELEGGDDALGKDVAMHIAASRPSCITSDEVSQDMLDKEKEIFSAQAAESGKPPEIIEKMVEGRLKKFVNEITLYGQPFVKDPDQTVEKLLKSASAKVVSFDRLEVGEGIEKKVENFAEEVKAQMQGA